MKPTFGQQDLNIGFRVYEDVFGRKKEEPITEFDKFTIHHLFANVWGGSTEYCSDPEAQKDTTIYLKERSMITIALLAGQGRLEELKSHIGAGLHLGISEGQINEIMIHVAHYAGWPAGHSGYKIAQDVFKNRKSNLKELNLKIGEEEKRGNIDFFNHLMTEDLKFIRANGSVVTKPEFLKDLREGMFDKLSTEIENIDLYNNIAVVTAKVTAKRKTDELEGNFLNIRLFIYKDGDWMLASWVYTKMNV